MRPVIHAIQGVFCLPHVAQALQSVSPEGLLQRAGVLSQELTDISTFIWSALEDVSASLGRFHSAAVHQIRDLWLDRASLPDAWKDAMRRRPVVAGQLSADSQTFSSGSSGCFSVRFCFPGLSFPVC